MKKKLISGRHFLPQMLLMLLSHFSTCIVLGQGMTVSGKVTAASGEALQGVSVSLKDTKITRLHSRESLKMKFSEQPTAMQVY